MRNLERKITIDDLIVEYMISKVENGYKPEFTSTEFIHFLHYFNNNMEMSLEISNPEQIFNNFFKEKLECDWLKNKPHMERLKHNGEYIIKANYRLGDYDKRIINTNFMEEDLVIKVRKTILDYLSYEEKRIIDTDIDVSDNDLKVAKYIAAEMVNQVWNNFIEINIKRQLWPSQCRDINKYLFEMDLATMINIASIKDRLIEFNKVIIKRIAILYKQDRNLKFSNSSKSYLEKANYDLIVKGFEDIMSIVNYPYPKNLSFDLSKVSLDYKKGFEAIFYYDEDAENKVGMVEVETTDIKKLVRTLDKETN